MIILFADGVAEVSVLLDYVPHCVYHLVDLSDYRDDDLRGAVRLQVAWLTLKYMFGSSIIYNETLDPVVVVTAYFDGEVNDL